MQLGDPTPSKRRGVRSHRPHLCLFCLVYRGSLQNQHMGTGGDKPTRAGPHEAAIRGRQTSLYPVQCVTLFLVSQLNCQPSHASKRRGFGCEGRCFRLGGMAPSCAVVAVESSTSEHRRGIPDFRCLEYSTTGSLHGLR